MPNGNPAPSLPVEIWRMILQYAISVPGFFDPDEMVVQFPPWVIAKRGWPDDSSYYEAERTRNALRRVCRSWDESLRRYAHRLVRMSDVIHGNLPLQYLQSASRVSFDNHEIDLCTACKPEQFGLDIEESVSDRLYSQLCTAILEQEKPFRAEILEDEIEGCCDIPPHAFPDLVCIRAMKAILYEGKACEIIESHRSLRHLYTLPDLFEARLLSLKSSTLTTLYISFANMGSYEDLHLPALKNLHIEDSFYREEEYPEPAWLPLVRVLGGGLRCLRVPTEWGCTMVEMPGEIWELCPKLEDLCHPYKPPITSPPTGHPVHTLGVPDKFSTYSLLENVPDWPGLRTVRINVLWEYLKVNHGLWEDSTTLIEWFASRRLSLEDGRGEPYIEFLARAELKSDSL
jgi:hypothetical protein